MQWQRTPSPDRPPPTSTVVICWSTGPAKPEASHSLLGAVGRNLCHPDGPMNYFILIFCGLNFELSLMKLLVLARTACTHTHTDRLSLPIQYLWHSARDCLNIVWVQRPAWFQGSMVKRLQGFSALGSWNCTVAANKVHAQSVKYTFNLVQAFSFHCVFSSLCCILYQYTHCVPLLIF